MPVVVRIEWEHDGEEHIETEALGWSNGDRTCGYPTAGGGSLRVARRRGRKAAPTESPACRTCPHLPSRHRRGSQPLITRVGSELVPVRAVCDGVTLDDDGHTGRLSLWRSSRLLRLVRRHHAEFLAGAIVYHAPVFEGVVESHPHVVATVVSRVVLRVDPDTDFLSRLLNIGG